MFHFYFFFAIPQREINRAALSIVEQIGTGQFGVVVKAVLDERSTGGVPGYMVAAKVLKTDSEVSTTHARATSHSHPKPHPYTTATKPTTTTTPHLQPQHTHTHTHTKSTTKPTTTHAYTCSQAPRASALIIVLHGA